MARRIHEIQTAFTAGEFDPLLAEREDLQKYFSSAKEMTNAIPLPQGGFRRRDGTKFNDKIRNFIVPVSTAGATVTAPEGGTAANAVDGDPTTKVTGGAIGVINPYVLVHFDFTVATLINLIDVIDISLSAGTLDNEFRLQSSTDNIIFVDFGDPFNLSANDRSRRRSLGPGLPVVARYWRLVRIGSTSIAGTVSVGEIIFFAETAALSKVRLMPFTFSDDQQYILSMTEKNIDIFNKGVFVASASIPHVETDIPTVNWTQSLDTLLLFHKNSQPHRLFRQGSDDEWDFRAQSFTNIPQFDFGDTPGGVNEVQQIRFLTWVDGETFNIFLDTERTSSIVFAATIGATAANIQTALRALKNTSATGIVCVGSGDTVTITFGGADGLTNFPEVDPAILVTVAGVLITSTVTEGEAPGEDIISATRGWPRCGTFYQQRLFMGGFKALPSHLMYSVAGEFFNLDDRTVRDDRGAVFTADTDQAAVIYQLFAGRHLQVFTSSSEFFLPLEPIAPLNTAIKQTTRRGIPEGLRVVENEGASFFVQKGGNALREYLFTDAEQSYKASPISLLASQLILKPTSVAINPSLTVDAADIYFMANGTADATIFVTLRDENVGAFVRFRTDGLFLSVASEDLGDLYVAVERTVNGAQVRYLEKFDSAQFMDSGDDLIVSVGTTQITGIDHLEGRTINFIIDGSPTGSAVVSGGIAILPVTANSSVIYGLNFIPRVETQGVKTQLPNGTSIGRKKRIIAINISLVDTTNIEVGTNNEKVQSIPFRTLGDDLLDASLDSFAFTGNKKVGGLTGWVDEASVVITQLVPGKMTVRSVTKTVATTSS